MGLDRSSVAASLAAARAGGWRGGGNRQTKTFRANDRGRAEARVHPRPPLPCACDAGTVRHPAETTVRLPQTRRTYSGAVPRRVLARVGRRHPVAVGPDRRDVDPTARGPPTGRPVPGVRRGLRDGGASLTGSRLAVTWAYITLRTIIIFGHIVRDRAVGGDGRRACPG